MHRYFFHVHDGEDYIDLRGTVLDDLAAARREAVRFASALLMEKPDVFWTSTEWRMRVTDDRDMTLFELMFIATDSPAVS